MPDVLKLARGVEDALTGIVWRDDAQIVNESLSKVVVAPPRPAQPQVNWEQLSLVG